MPARPGARLETSPRCARRRPGMATIAQAPLPAPTSPILALSRLVACPRKELPWKRWQELTWAPPEAPASRPLQAARTYACPRLTMHRPWPCQPMWTRFGRTAMLWQELAWAPPEAPASRPHQAAWTYACPRLTMHRPWPCQPMWTRFGRTAMRWPRFPRWPPDRATGRQGPSHFSALAVTRPQRRAGHRLRCRWPLASGRLPSHGAARPVKASCRFPNWWKAPISARPQAAPRLVRRQKLATTGRDRRSCPAPKIA